MSDLKPCPMCGGKPHEVDPSFYGDVFVCCQNEDCPIEGIYMMPEQWNHRPAENKIKADAVRGAVEDSRLSSSDICRVECLIDYADKLEKGEIE